MTKTENNYRTTVTSVPGSDFALHIGEETTGLLSFVMASGDGYSLEELGENVKAIAAYVRCEEKDVGIYSSLDYEDIPFEDIYELWSKLWGDNRHDSKPSYEDYNTYDHGFFHLLAFTEKGYHVVREVPT